MAARKTKSVSDKVPAQKPARSKAQSTKKRSAKASADQSKRAARRKAPASAKGRGAKGKRPTSKRQRPAKETVISGVPASIGFTLPERFDSTAAFEVLDTFKQRRGGDLDVDASCVRRVGAQAMQILISASLTWQKDGHSLNVMNPSAELIDAANLLGISQSDLSISGSLQ